MTPYPFSADAVEAVQGASREGRGRNSARDLTLAQDSLQRARAILKVQAYPIERGRYGDLHAMIEKHGRQIDTLIKPTRRGRH